MIRETTRLHEYLPVLKHHKTWVEVDTAALRANYRALRDPIVKQNPHARMIAVVKADAYGHGIEPCVHSLRSEGCRDFAVSGIEEAIAIREILRKTYPDVPDQDISILILGYTLPKQAGLLADYRIATTVLSEDYAKELSHEATKQGVSVTIHLAVDTGMNRIGIPAHSEGECGEAVDCIERIAALDGLRIEGMFTHFANADDPQDRVEDQDGITMVQYRRYKWVLEQLTKRGLRPGLCHVCNSAAAYRFPNLFPEGCLDAVRLGIMLYGVSPSKHVPCSLKPVMRLKTVISHVHTLLPGEAVSYGGCYTASEPREIATLPIGYADGFVRAYSGASVTIHADNPDGKGKIRLEAPIVGRICMDQCMIDVTGLPVHVGDVVTLFGDRPEQLTALADQAATIEYECLCLISARVPRIRLDSGQKP